jgi:hypothetical protein
MVVLIVALILVTTHGSDSAHGLRDGVDDWKPADLAKFFAESIRSQLTSRRVSEADLFPSVSEAKIVALGLTSSDLFDGAMTNSLLTELGVTSEIQQNAVQAAIAKLDAKVTHAPVDFFEWRIANLREFELWLSPLAMGAPRICALYGRFNWQADAAQVLVATLLFAATLSRFVVPGDAAAAATAKAIVVLLFLFCILSMPTGEAIELRSPYPFPPPLTLPTGEAIELRSPYPPLLLLSPCPQVKLLLVSSTAPLTATSQRQYQRSN